MPRQFLRQPRHLALSACTLFFLSAGLSRAEDKEAELRSLIEKQNQQIQELKQRLDSITNAPTDKKDPADPAGQKLSEDAVKGIIKDYLKENPGAGLPSGVQTGYSPSPGPGGFFIRSTPDPNYVKWDDECKIPFELRIRGRVQLDYYNYKITDSINHTTQRNATANANEPNVANFSALEVKRTRIVFAGTAFDPNLRYWLEIDGNTRGLGGLQNNRVVQTAGAFAPNTSPASPISGGVTTDNAVRLFSAYVAYDFHGCASEKGCGPDCPEGSYKYAPTYTVIVGKAKPYFAFEEYLGSANEQFVEYGMSEWMFDADNDNLLTLAGTQIKALDDRLFAMAVVTNGADNQFASSQLTNYPGFNAGFWYDFGGSWNQQTHKWNLYGDSVSDIDYSCNPVVRVGAMTYIVPMNRRSLYGDAEQSFYFTTPGGPGGTRLINILNGDTLTPNGAHAVDDFDAYTYETFWAAKYKGFSILNDWFFRDLNHFRTTPNGQGNIVYQDSTGANALFPANHGLFDYGFQLQAGYFIVPKQWEVAVRWNYIRGNSGDINGNGKFTTTTIPGVMTPVRVINGAFSNFHEADEYSIGLNYYFKRQLLKWQTDVSYYKGGNPAGGGVSPAGFIAGSDGWMLRTQIQMAF